jgi:hypothetical protein
LKEKRIEREKDRKTLYIIYERESVRKPATEKERRNRKRKKRLKETLKGQTESRK